MQLQQKWHTLLLSKLFVLPSGLFVAIVGALLFNKLLDSFFNITTSVPLEAFTFIMLGNISPHLDDSKTQQAFTDEESQQEITDSQHQLRHIQLQNDELAVQLANCENTPYTLYRFIKPLLTLDEFQLHNAIVEVTAAFTAATKVGLYLVDTEYKALHLVTTYGLSDDKTDLSTCHQVDSPFFRLLIQAKRTLNIREIVANKQLYTLWRQQTMPALIYTPILGERRFMGIITIYELPFRKLHRSTLRALEIIADLAGVALKNAARRQSLFDKFPLPQGDFLLDFQHFRQVLNFEFQRSKRHKLDLSVVLMAITPIGNERIPPTASPFWNKIAEIIQTNVRVIDYVSTGEKTGYYWLLLPLTKLEGLAILMERMQQEIMQLLGAKSRYRLLMGFSTFNSRMKSAQEPLQKARQGLRLHRFVQKLLYA